MRKSHLLDPMHASDDKIAKPEPRAQNVSVYVVDVCRLKKYDCGKRNVCMQNWHSTIGTQSLMTHHM
jgi:hypothetical protein